VPPIGSTVDISKGTCENTIGSTELKTVCTDPDFDPSLDAFYYARVLLTRSNGEGIVVAHQKDPN
jgi:hypothetical protein